MSVVAGAVMASTAGAGEISVLDVEWCGVVSAVGVKLKESTCVGCLGTRVCEGDMSANVKCGCTAGDLAVSEDACSHEPDVTGWSSRTIAGVCVEYELGCRWSVDAMC